MKYTKECLEGAAKNANSVMDVMRTIRAPISGGGHAHISKKLKQFKIDITHFKHHTTNLIEGAKLRSRTKKRDPNNILCFSSSERRVPRKLLHRALQEIGRVYECETCGISTHNDLPITLEIDHIDGNWKNNERENLRYVCPNCHSQAPTSHRKNMKVTDEQLLDACKKFDCLVDIAKSVGGTRQLYDRIRRICESNRIKVYSYLEKHAKPKKIVSGFTGSNKSPEWIEKIGLANRRVERPSADELLNLINAQSIESLSNVYGVSGNAIRKWCKAYGIKTKPVGFWAKKKSDLDI